MKEEKDKEIEKLKKEIKQISNFPYNRRTLCMWKTRDGECEIQNTLMKDNQDL